MCACKEKVKFYMLPQLSGCWYANTVLLADAENSRRSNGGFVLGFDRALSADIITYPVFLISRVAAMIGVSFR